MIGNQANMYLFHFYDLPDRVRVMWLALFAAVVVLVLLAKLHHQMLCLSVRKVA